MVGQAPKMGRGEVPTMARAKRRIWGEGAGAEDGQAWSGRVRSDAADRHIVLVPCGCPTWCGVDGGGGNEGWPEHLVGCSMGERPGNRDFARVWWRLRASTSRPEDPSIFCPTALWSRRL